MVSWHWLLLIITTVVNGHLCWIRKAISWKHFRVTVVVVAGGCPVSQSLTIITIIFGGTYGKGQEEALFR